MHFQRLPTFYYIMTHLEPILWRRNAYILPPIYLSFCSLYGTHSLTHSLGKFWLCYDEIISWINNCAYLTPTEKFGLLFAYPQEQYPFWLAFSTYEQQQLLGNKGQTQLLASIFKTKFVNHSNKISAKLCSHLCDPKMGTCFF